MSFFTHDSIRTAAAGHWLARPDPTVAVHGAAVDSRVLRPGQIFIALKGQQTDGHRFTADAVSRGAAIIIVDRDDAVPADAQQRGVGVLKVADTRKALLRLGAACRRAMESTRVIAVGGSNGKTTTVRLLQSVLSTRLRGTASPRSFNNDIGVPLTLLNARPGDHYVICEVGTNAPGEIAALADVVQPDIAVITSIGREHLEGLGSIAGVAREEGAVFRSIRPGGLAVYAADCAELRPLAPTGLAAVRFGLAEDADLRLTAWEPALLPDGRPGVRLRINDRWTFAAPLEGRHNALNCCAAVAVARRLNIDDDLIAAGLLAAEPPEMRWQRLTIANAEIINDAYNANPESMLAAMRTFAELPRPAGRRALILADMLELGPAGPDAHAEIAQAVADLTCADLVLLLGPLMAHAAERLARAAPGVPVRHFPATDDRVFAAVAAEIRPGDRVLLKGSRSMRLERVLDALRQAQHRPVVPAGANPAPARS
ncbi:MAG: UDP-N-acetylmuramoyl-tripeptide--D-alanyl-D-alanine ligase [Phycisphaerae bacterium]|nr:UDP-N-acetylmuramoyl-tripeptide--D-alanyl-D-alanine ligase [Phycisphaerae bacterium]